MLCAWALIRSWQQGDSGVNGVVYSFLLQRVMLSAGSYWSTGFIWC